MDTNPSFTYGITLNASYKGFDLTVFGTGAAGNDVFMCIQRPDKLESSAGTGSSQGIDKGSYPVSKKIVAGINITF